MTTLFSLADYNTAYPVHDPYWDEITTSGNLSSMTVTESLMCGCKDDSVTASNDYTESVSQPHNDDSVTDSVTRHGCIDEYTPKGQARGNNRYFRYSYKHRGRVYHYHVPGGNCSSKLAQARAEKIRRAIADGKLPCEILEIIKNR